ncbi:MAG: hypothetical protein ACK4U0_14325 [Mesorhizobium sp.]
MDGDIDDRDAPHIFRSADGHVADTPSNRELLLSTYRPAHLLGRDRFGNAWYARNLPDGRQVWVQCRGDRIRNGGVNAVPRQFHILTGLSKPEKSNVTE